MGNYPMGGTVLPKGKRTEFSPTTYAGVMREGILHIPEAKI